MKILSNIVDKHTQSIHDILCKKPLFKFIIKLKNIVFAPN